MTVTVISSVTASGAGTPCAVTNGLNLAGTVTGFSAIGMTASLDNVISPSPVTPILIWAFAAPENAKAATSATPDNQYLVIHVLPVGLGRSALPCAPRQNAIPPRPRT